ncbi:hypothetical protein AAEP93_007645 [Penicillium crustosum]
MLPIATAFDGVANSSSEAIAVQFEETQFWTYAQLQKASRQIAQGLDAHVGPGQSVAVLLPRSPTQIAAIIAILRLGAVYVPINMDLPQGRIEQLLAQLTDPLVLCLHGQKPPVLQDVNQAWLAVNSQEKSINVICNKIASRDLQEIRREVHVEDVAAVLFTSGSTGLPKGVWLTHQNLLWPAQTVARQMQITPASRMLQFSQCSFDAHLIDILSTILYGGCLLQVSQDNVMSDLTGWIRRMNPNTAHFTPSTILLLDPLRVPSIKRLVVSGEQVSRDLVDRWANRVHLVNLYGPCEASSITFKILHSGDDFNSVGKAASYASIAIVDAAGIEQSAGVPGELAVKGETVFQGYCNFASHDRFLGTVQRLNGPDRGPWYLTGDRAYVDQSGEFHLLGRDDDQVKINGQRVELGEIEHAIQHHVGRVIVRAHRVDGHTRLFALVSTAKTLGAPDKEIELEKEAHGLQKTVVAVCRGLFPAYMVPRVLVVEALPQSRNGKIDLQKIKLFLAQLYENDQEPKLTMQQLDEMEDRIQRLVYQRLLQHVPKNDSLFDWGFSSLDAMFLAQLLFDTTGCQISFRQILEAPRIIDIARFCRGGSSMAAAPPLPLLCPAGKCFTPTIGQESMLNACMVFGNQMHILTFAYEIESTELDPSLLLKCVQTIYDRHEAFNTTYEHDFAVLPSAQARVNAQGSLPNRTVFHPWTKSENCTEDAKKVEIFRRELNRDADMDLMEDSPAWTALHQLTQRGEKWLVVFKFHHLVIDELSFDIFLSEVQELYSSGCKKQLPPPATQYSQFAQVHRKDTEEKAARDLSWWNSLGKSLRPSNLFAEHHGMSGSLLSLASDIYWHDLHDSDVTNLLKHSGNGTSMFISWLGFTQVFLSRMTGKEQYLLGVPTSHRTIDRRFTTVVGYCVSLIVVPVLVKPKKTITQHIAEMSKLYWECVEHQQSVEDVLRCFAATEGGSQHAGLNVQFAFHERNVTQSVSDGVSLPWQEVQAPSRGSHYDLIIHIDSSSHPRRVGFEYRTEVLNKSAIIDWAAAFEQLLGSIDTAVDPRVSEDPLTGITEAQNVLSPTLSRPIEIRTSESQVIPATRLDLSVTNAGLDAATIHDALQRASIVDSDVEYIYAPSAMQLSMLLQASLSPSTYNLTLALHLEGRVDVQQLRNAWYKVVTAHPALRTIFHGIDHESLPYVGVELKPGIRVPVFNFVDQSAMTFSELSTLLDSEQNALHKTRNGLLHRFLLVRATDDQYNLVLTMHHAIIDGWSLRRLMADLRTAYANEKVVAGISISTLLAEKTGLDKNLARIFWSQYLATAKGPDVVKSDVDAGDQLTPDIKIIQPRRPSRITPSALSGVSRKFGVTSFTVVQALLGLVLPRTNQTKSTIFWTTSSGRADLTGDVDAIGNFLTSIPCVVNVEDDVSIESWLKQTQKGFQKSLEYDYLPTPDILKCLPETQTQVHTLIIFENHPGEGLEGLAEDIRITKVEGQEYSDVPLTIIVQPNEESVTLTAKVDQNRVHSGLAQRILDRLQGACEELCSAVTTCHTTQSLAAHSNEYLEKSAALSQNLEIRQQPSSSEHLVSLFIEAAKRYPDCLALSTVSSQITFAELNYLTAKVARKLIQTSGNRPGVVTLFLDRGITMIIAMIAALRAGMTYCPLEYDAPSARLDKQTRQINASLVISDHRGFSRLGTGFYQGLQTLDIDQALQSPVNDLSVILPVVSSESLAYIMFTSGTTSEPKACTLSHRAVAQYVRQAIVHYGFKPGSRVLLCANYVFDASVTDIFGCLTSGATLCQVPEDSLRSDLAMCINTLRIDSLHVTPSMLGLLTPSSVLTLRTVILGGEIISPDLVEQWAECVDLYGSYGPTETAVQVLIHCARKGTCIAYDALPGNLVILVNRDGEVCYADEPGEVLIAGNQLFEGYYGNKTATEGAITRLPAFGNTRFYRTGDLGVYTPELRIRILGRHDHQLKVSGVRINPDEVESVLRLHPTVHRAVVTVVNGRLQAAVEAHEPKHDLETMEIMEFCKIHLPERLVPIVSQVNEIPTLPMGVGSPTSGSLSPNEKLIAGLVKEITGNDVSSAHVPLQQLGLDSLGLMRLRGALAKQYNISLTYVKLRRARTLNGIAALLQPATCGESIVPSCPTLEHQSIALGSYPALRSQVTMWLAQERLQDATYNVERTIELSGLSGAAVLAGVMAVTSQLEMFRTAFAHNKAQGKVLQILGHQVLIEAHYHTLSAEKDAMQQVKEILAGSSSRALDLHRGPLSIFHVFSESENRSYLSTTIHHILLDAYTAAEVTMLIVKASRGELVVNHNDNTASYAKRLTEAGNSQADQNRRLENWLAMLQGALPFVPARPALTNGAGFQSVRRRSFLGPSWHGEISFDILLALFLALMHRYSGSGDVLVTTPVSERGYAPGASTVLGNLTHTAFLRSRLSGQDSFNELLTRTQASIEFAMENIVPLESVFSQAGRKLDDHSVQFVTHDNRPFEQKGMVDRTLDVVDQSRPMFDLMWHVFIHEDAMEILVEYNTERHHGAWMHSAIDGYATLVSTIANKKNQPVNSLLNDILPPPWVVPERVTFSQAETMSTSSNSIKMSPDPSSPDVGDHSEKLQLNKKELPQADGLDSLATSLVLSTKCNTPSNDSTADEEVDSASLSLQELKDAMSHAICKSLGITTVDPDRNLRELGLDSFASMAFISHMYNFYPELEIGIHDIVQYPTISDLANYALQIQANDSPLDPNMQDHEYLVVSPSASNEEGVKVAQASSIQRRFFLLQEQLGDTTYIVPLLYLVVSQDLSKVLDAVQKIAQHHEIFRTTFDLEGDTVVQKVASYARYSFEVDDLRHRGNIDEAKLAMRQVCAGICGQEFDLTMGPLLRCRGFILPDGQQYVFLNFHHIIADEQSVSCFVRHVEMIVKKKGPIDTIVPSTSYLDFSERHNRALQPDHISSARKWWTEQMRSQPLKAWSTSHESQTEQFAPAKHVRHIASFDFDPASWAYSCGATPFGTYLFTLQLLLTLRSGSRGSTILIPATSRSPRFGEQEMYGCFVNTLPVPMIAETDTTAMESLMAFNPTLFKILGFSNLPFENIMEFNGHKMGDFDMMFVYHEDQKVKNEASMLQPAMDLMPALPGITAKFPITFSMTRCVNNGSTTLKMYVEHNPNLVSSDEAATVCQQFEDVLRLLTLRQGDLSLDVIRQTLDHGPVVPYSFHGKWDRHILDDPLSDIQIMQQAKKTPETTAIVFEDSASVTYRELVEMVHGVAHFLCSQVPASELHRQNVCIVGDVSIARIVAILAIMSIGAAYIPLDMKNPLEWNATIIRDCNPKCILFLPEESGSARAEASNSLRAYLPTISSSIHGIGITTPLPKATNPAIDMQRRSEMDLAYVLYTSGSTGVPKGVAIEHRALKNSVHEHVKLYHLSAEIRLLALAPWTFDVSLMDLFGPLVVGATMCIGRNDYVFSDIEEVATEMSITHISTTPTVAALLRPSHLPSVRMLAIGGEPLTAVVRDTWAEKVTLMNVYGPTEATVDVVCRQVARDTSPKNIGWPLTNVFVFIVNEEMQQVSVGEVGQLAVSGPQVARGYIREPQGKPSPFVNHPLYGRLYLTGDYAQFEPDGSVICLGRMDTMVNLRGLRIELGAIEQVVDKVLDTGKCVTLKIERDGQEALVAIFTNKNEQSEIELLPRPVGQELARLFEFARALSNKLPSYFMPTYWIPVTGFPRNKSQKLDRKAIQKYIDAMPSNVLSQYRWDQSEPKEAQKLETTPKVEHTTLVMTSNDSLTPSQETIRQAFSSVLGDKAYTPGSNFFSLGGDSISAIRLCSALRAKGAQVKVRELYERPTIEKLAVLVEQRMPEKQGSIQPANSPPKVQTSSVNSEVERIIIDAMYKVLSAQDVKVDSNFFTLGGDSISAIRFSTTLRSAGFSVKVRDIYETPTARLLATKLSPSRSSFRASQPSHVSAATPIPPPPEPTVATQISLKSPGSAPELVTVVCAAFRKVLGGRSMEDQSNFFTLGGDSISAIRCCTALRSSGFTVKVRDIYENPTVTALASLLAQRGPKPEQQSPSHVSNASLLRNTPIVEWFFRSARANENWFNQGHVIQLADPHRFTDLERAWQTLTSLHPMLRARVVGEGSEKSIAVPNSSNPQDYCVLRRNMNSWEEFRQAAQELQSRLNIRKGPICGLGDFTVESTVYAVIVINHLAVDVVSWHIIWHDLDCLLQGIRPEDEFNTFKDWSDHLATRSTKKRLLDCPASEAGNDFFDIDAVALQKNTGSSVHFASLKSPAEIVELATKVHDVEVVDIILAALLLAIRRWKSATRVELNFESHGRELNHETLDVTRTVGWFTYIIPISFSLLPDTAGRDFVKQVREHRINAVRQIDCAAPIPDQVQTHPCTFNYLGYTTSSSSYASFKKVRADIGPLEDPRNRRCFTIDFEAAVSNNLLTVGAFFSTELFSRESLTQLLEFWTADIRDLSTNDSSCTPVASVESVIPMDAALESDRPAIEASLGSHRIPAKSVEEVLPATDMQTAMMLASLGSRSYMHRYDYVLEVQDLDRFCRAWEEVFINRHSIFRTVLIPISRPGSTTMAQVVLQKETVVGRLLVREEPPKTQRAMTGQLLSVLYVFKSSAGSLNASWVCHHALMDGWSRRLVFDEVRRLYAGHTLSSPPAQFRDLVFHLQSQKEQNDQFWSRFIENAQPSLLVEHGADERLSVRQPKSRQYRIRINVDPEDMQAVARDHCTTISALYQASWGLTLAVYLSSADVTFGLINAGRSLDLDGIHAIVGPCLNNTPMRIQVNWTDKMSQYIEQVSEVSMERSQYEGLSLRQIYAASGQSDLFNTTLLVPFSPLAVASSSNPTGPSSSFKMELQSRDEVTDLPLLMSVEQGVSVAKTTVLTLRTNSRQFSQTFCERLLYSFGKSLEYVSSLARGIDCTLSDISLLDENHSQILDRHARGGVFPDQYAWTSYQLLSYRVQQTPQSLAVEYHQRGQTKTLTYEQLETQVQMVAAHLAAAGIEHRTRIALFLDKSIELVVSIFAAHCLDCAYVPLDIESPAASITTLIEQTDPSAIITTPNLRASLPNNLVPVFTTDTLFSPQKSISLSRRSQNAGLDDLAAVLFTSGTTGTPKGVSMPHRQIVGYGIMMAQAVGYTTTDRIFWFARPVFDVSQSDLFGSVFAGATLVITPHADAMARLAPLLAQLQITSTSVTPSIASLLRPQNLPLIRSLFLAGEMASQEVIRRWSSTVRVINGYGPTEGVVVAWKHMKPDTSPHCIGRTAIGMDVFVLDAHMRQAPIGVRGTIWIAGRQLSQGYFGQPGVTDQVFRPNIFGHGLIYNTGDIGVWSHAGELLYLSREDRQVKINGRRVELAEIESSLSTDSVQVAVLLLNTAGDRKELVAFFAQEEDPQKNHSVVEAELSAQANRYLPPHMVPRRFISIPHLPLNGNAKIDTKRLEQDYLNGSLPYAKAITTKTARISEDPIFPKITMTDEELDGRLSEAFIHFPPALSAENKTAVETSKRPTMFLFFAVTGTSVQYRLLAQRLPTYRVIGVDHLRPNQPEAYPSITSMAADLAAILRRQQPRGPYNLGGFSFGGLVAWAVAKYLEQHGETVRLILIDSEALVQAPIPPPASTQDSQSATAEQEMREKMYERLFDIPSREIADPVAIPELAEFRDTLLTQAHHNLAIHDVFRPEVLRAPVLLICRCMEKKDHPEEVRFDGNSNRHQGACQGTNGFAEFAAGRLDVRCVPSSDHYTMLKEERCLQAIGKILEEDWRERK